MATFLRILSGMVKIPRGGTSQGSFEVTFNPFELAAASHQGVELRKRKEIGPDGRYDRSPASIVTPRQFSITPLNPSQLVNINDSVTRDSLTVDWVASRRGRVDLEEITFMIIGEVSVELPDLVVPPDIPVFLPVGIMKSRRGPREQARRKTRRKKRR